MGKQTLLVIALVFLVTLIFGFGGYYYFFQRIPTTSQTFGPSVAPTSAQKPPGWKTYTNKQYNFTLNYPDNFSPDEVNSSGRAFSVVFLGPPNSSTLNLITDNHKESDKEFYYGGFNWTKSVVDQLNKLDSGSESDFRYEHLTKLGSFSVNGFTGVKYESAPLPAAAIKSESHLNLAIVKDSQSYFLTVPKTLSTVFDDIVASFKP